MEEEERQSESAGQIEREASAHSSLCGTAMPWVSPLRLKQSSPPASVWALARARRNRPVQRSYASERRRDRRDVTNETSDEEAQWTRKGHETTTMTLAPSARLTDGATYVQLGRAWGEARGGILARLHAHLVSPRLDSAWRRAQGPPASRAILPRGRGA